MSWEVMHDRIEQCECGKGHTRYVSEMNDWNDSRTREYIDCKECYEKYLEYKTKSFNCPNEAKHDYTEYIYVEKIELNE